MASPRWLVLVASLLVPGLFACGGSASSSTQKTQDDPLGWGDQTRVEAVFEASCAGCHGAQWGSCWNVHASATTVGDAISSGAMPQSGPLSESDKSLVLGWLQEGAACTGTPPAGGGSSGGTPGGFTINE